VHLLLLLGTVVLVQRVHHLCCTHQQQGQMLLLQAGRLSQPVGSLRMGQDKQQPPTLSTAILQATA
jgi:hypothetical protein